MSAPLSLSTRKRQSAFILVGFTYLCVFAFDIEVSKVGELGLNISFPAEFAEFVLLVASIFLFVRYAADGFAELSFFDWYSKNSDQHNHNRISIEQVEGFLRHLDSFDAPHFQHLLQTTQPTLLPANLQNFRSRIVNMAKKDPSEKAAEEWYANRDWLESECKGALEKLKRERFLLRTRKLSVAFVLVFDVLVPLILFLLILAAWLCGPQWLKYSFYVA